MSEELQAEPDRIAKFLRMAVPDGPYVLGAIRVERGAPKVRTFEDADEAAAWAASMNAARAHNLYWIHNRLKARATEKPKEEDVAEVRFLHVDCDPPKKLPREDMTPEELDEWTAKQREGLLDGLVRVDPEPSFIVDSGGGYQAFWRLDVPLFIDGDANRIADAKAYNIQLRNELSGGDKCQSLEHLMRLAGTVNWPDKAKRALGRVARLAAVIHDNGRAYPLHDFKPAPAEKATSAKPKGSAIAERGEVRRLANPAELEQWGVSPRMQAVIVHGEDPEDPDRYASRSEAVFAVCRGLVECGVPDGLIVGIITDPDWPISGHVRDQTDSDAGRLKYAWAQVEAARAKAAVAADAFQTNEDGKPRVNQHNIRLAVRKLGVRVRFDTFANRPMLEGLDGFGPHLDDAGMTRLWLLVDEVHRIKTGKDYFWSVVEDAARRDAFHPVVEYLAGLEWDAVERLDRWMSSYLGAEDSEYIRAVGALMLVAAVRRARRPGCKFDEMVILESEQGKAKSTALAILATREDWFSDDLPLGAKAQLVIERTEGRWIIEAAELAGMNKKGIENLKAFLSRRIDRARMAYGRLSHEAPRHFVVIGTTNDDKYLSDSTGNRRFWPVRVGDIDLDALRRDRDQLWAEAAAREAAGASIRLDRALWQAAAVEQDDRRLVDPFVQVLADVLGDLNGKVLSKDVWEVIGTPAGLRTPQLEARLGNSMRELGFEHGQRRFGGNPEACYLRGDKSDRLRRILIEREINEYGGATGPWVARIDGSADTDGSARRLDLDNADQPY